jgi:hypothetical protein
VSRFSPLNPNPYFELADPAVIDFQEAFLRFWNSDDGLSGVFTGGIHEGAAGFSTDPPFAIAGFAEAEFGESMDDMVFNLNLSCFAVTDTQAKTCGKYAAAKIMKTQYRRQLVFGYDGKTWLEAGVRRSKPTTLAPAKVLPDGSEVWRCDQAFRFMAAAYYE